MHEEGAHAPIARTRVRPRQQRTSGAAAAVAIEHRHSQLGVAIDARDMRFETLAYRWDPDNPLSGRAAAEAAAAAS